MQPPTTNSSSRVCGWCYDRLRMSAPPECRATYTGTQISALRHSSVLAYSKCGTPKARDTPVSMMGESEAQLIQHSLSQTTYPHQQQQCSSSAHNMITCTRTSIFLDAIGICDMCKTAKTRHLRGPPSLSNHHHHHHAAPDSNAAKSLPPRIVAEKSWHPAIPTSETPLHWESLTVYLVYMYQRPGIPTAT